MKIIQLRKIGVILASTVLAVGLLTGCETKEQVEEEPVVLDLNVGDSSEEVVEEASEEVEEEFVEGKYRSELTNEWIDQELKSQRPIAVMVDNEITALDHYGVNQGDVVYEMMNSTMNGRITRLMVLIKDWEKIERLGSIRSTRPTNVLCSWEWNAILIHDGGPFYINDYIDNERTDHLSGGFARFSNGKSMEFTEYVTYEDYSNPTTGKSFDGLKDRLANSNIDTEYNSYYLGPHFKFAKGHNDYTSDANAQDAMEIDLPFTHNESKLIYNEETKKYEYYEYNKPHIDAGDNNEVTSFENVIVISMDFTKYDENGYLIYNDTAGNKKGYYLTEGTAIPIFWLKNSSYDIMNFYTDTDKQDLYLNTGKTYIAYVPSDSWEDVEIK